MMIRLIFFIFIFLGVVIFLPAQKNGKQIKSLPEPANTAFDYNQALKPVKWRCIGPFKGGRANAAAGDVSDPYTFYMGATGGGVWKTADAGTTWSNISDGYFGSGSVGAIAVSESDPNIIYVGTGEHAVRGVMTHHGDGIYKSYDGGKTWKKMGLDSTQHIARIIVHPKNPDIVLVAAQGALYGPTRVRGIYKSIDGGETWIKVLYVNENTGCAELSMDMNNPMVVYGAMWEHGRKPWKITSGGSGSGLYKSVDGGNNWEKIQNGLPDELGKMSVAVCRSNSDKVYALIESDSEKEAGGLFVSDDAGKNWSLVTNEHQLIQRAWYYTELYTNPQNENEIFVLSAPALKSIDGGRTWEEIYGKHGDYHDMWINPNNPKIMAIADDGGVAISVNGGKTWTSHESMPIGQFYRLNTDNLFPYNIYSGQQDFPSIKIASRQLGISGITSSGWSSSAGGESAFLAFDPDHPRYVMGGSYLGTIEVLDTEAKVETNIMAAPIQYLGREAKEMKYRYNWNAPIIWSKYEPNTYYHGAQILLKTKDMGYSWEEVSPDLTRNEKDKQGKSGGPYTNEAVGAENYGTISYVAESPIESGVIWVGSDDGLVHVTRDGCKKWKNVTPTVLGECLVNAIHVSNHTKGTAYIATTKYKFNNHTPAIYKTTDYGLSWQNISNGIPGDAFTRVIREDDVKKDLLFAGTEKGLFISYDGGKNWAAFQLNLPIVPINDLKVHQGNLIAATSGRSIWVLDDLTFLRQFQTDTSVAKFYTPSDVVLVNGYSQLDNNLSSFNGTHPSRGVNPSTGAVMYYYLPEALDSSDVFMEILDIRGNIVRTYSAKADSTYIKYDGGPSAQPLLSKSKGLNRFVWDLRHPSMPGVPKVYIESNYKGHKAVPGTYRIKLTTANDTLESMVVVKSNPYYKTDEKTYFVYDSIMNEMEAELTDMHRMVNTMYIKKNQLNDLLPLLSGNQVLSNLAKEAAAISNEMLDWDSQMVQRKSKAYDDVENYQNKFTANYLFMINHNESEAPVNPKATFERWKELNQEWQMLKNKANDILNNQLPNLNKKLWDAGVGAIWSK